MMADLIEGALRHGLRVATLLAASVIVLGLGLSNLLRHLDRHEYVLAQFGAMAALAVVLAGEVALLLRGRSWDRLRAPAIAVVMGATILSYATMPHRANLTSADWVFGAANWVGVVVLLDRPLRSCLAFLLAHEATALLNLLLFGVPTQAALARFATGSVSVVGFPLCLAVMASIVRRLGQVAADAHAETERVRVAEEATAQAHRLRLARYDELSASAVPLLEGLAGGSLDPGDPGVRRRCAIEAARMRRLFAEADSVADPLWHELRHCADVADRKGVAVELDARGSWPVPPVTVRRDLTEAVLTVLTTASSRARVTVVGGDDQVSVSVVADGDEVPAPRPASDDVLVEALQHGDLIWMEATWQLTTA